MKKIICFSVCMLLLVTAAGAISSPGIEVKKSVKSTSGRDYSHSILGEFFTVQNAVPSKYSHQALKNLYKGGWHPFYYISMVYDKNKWAKQRHDELEVCASPTVMWDGPFKKNQGSTEDVEWDMEKYNTSIIACGNRNVADIDLDVDVEWAGAVNPVPEDGKTNVPIEQCLYWNISAMKIDVTIDNNEANTYNGHLHVYVTEINSSVWDDTGGYPYTFAFLDYAWNENISISSGDTWNDSTEWDGCDHNDGHGHNFYWIEQDNIMVIASIFDDDLEYTDETAGFLAGVDTDPKTFDVYFGNNTPPPKVVSNISCNSFCPEYGLEFNTTYYWKVDVWDNQGNPTYGDIWSFSTRDNNPPYEPSNPIPPDGATNVSEGICWTGGDPDGDPVTYDVYLGNSSPPPKIISNQTSNCTDPGILEFNTTYYWKIVAWDIYGASTEGPIWSFTTQVNLPPYEPSDPHPPDGGTYVPVNVTLCWEGGDPNPVDSVTYDVYLGCSYPPHNLVSNNQSETYYEATGLELNKTYYWRIVAWDSQGLSTSGPCWTFTTGINHPPGAPIIKGPSGTPIIKGLLSAKPVPRPLPKPGTYNFTFKAKDPDGHDVYYYIDWGDGTTEGWIGPYPSGEKITRNHTWSEMGAFTIKAKAKDIYGAEGPWGTLLIEISQSNQQSSFMPSSQESELQNEELDSLLSSYGLDTGDTMGKFEQVLHNLASKRRWRNPSLEAELINDIDELSDILEQIGVTDDMTIAEALPIIENNKEQLQEEGINLFCSIDMYAIDGGCIPIFRLFKAMYGWWTIGPHWFDDYVTIKGLTGLQHCEGWECKDNYEGRFIGLIGFNPPVMWYIYQSTSQITWVRGDFVLFSRSNVPFVNSSGGSQQTPCPCNQQGNIQLKSNSQSIPQQSGKLAIVQLIR